MAGPQFPHASAALRCALAGSVLLVAAGCTTLPPPPASALPPSVAASAPTSASASAPASAAASAAEAAARTASEPAAETAAGAAPPAQPSRLAALAKRLLNKFKKPAVPAAEPEPAPQPEPVIDEKYRLTGEEALELERGRASWYAPRFQGQPTASGEPYDKYALTAAHKTLPFGTIVRVRSLALGREVDVRINDRGPFAPGRVIDVSQAAAEALGLTSSGVAEVSLKVADSQLDSDGVLEPRSKARSTTQARGRGAKGRKAGPRNAKSTKSAKSPGAKARARSSASAKGAAARHH